MRTFKIHLFILATAGVWTVICLSVRVAAQTRDDAAPSTSVPAKPLPTLEETIDAGFVSASFVGEDNHTVRLVIQRRKFCPTNPLTLNVKAGTVLQSLKKSIPGKIVTKLLGKVAAGGKLLPVPDITLTGTETTVYRLQTITTGTDNSRIDTAAKFVLKREDTNLGLAFEFCIKHNFPDYIISAALLPRSGADDDYHPPKLTKEEQKTVDLIQNYESDPQGGLVPVIDIIVEPPLILPPYGWRIVPFAEIRKRFSTKGIPVANDRLAGYLSVILPFSERQKGFLSALRFDRPNADEKTSVDGMRQILTATYAREGAIPFAIPYAQRNTKSFAPLKPDKTAGTRVDYEGTRNGVKTHGTSIVCLNPEDKDQLLFIDAEWQSNEEKKGVEEAIEFLTTPR